MIKTLIIDDEPIIREGLKNIIKNEEINLEIIGECGSVSEAVTIIKACKPELLLLDINLPDGNGFDIIQKTAEHNYNVIFVTAYDEFALKAIKLGALDYILKPIDPDELVEAVEKCNTRNNKSVIERALISKETLENKPKRIVLRLQDSFQVLEFDEIIYCNSEGSYTTFYSNDGKKIMVSKSIKEYEKQLPEDLFIRCHQSYLVNVKYISKYEKEGYLLLRNEVRIPVSVRKKEEVIKRLYL